MPGTVKNFPKNRLRHGRLLPFSCLIVNFEPQKTETPSAAHCPRHKKAKSATRMKRLITIAAVALAALALAAPQIQARQPRTAAVAGMPALTDYPVRDMALIYQGGTHRIPWTADQLEPYVTHRFADGTEDWLFDGFLFLEFKTGKGRTFSPGYDPLNARRTEWEWYLDRLFEPGKSLHALDSIIGVKKRQLGDPGFRHKVILTVFVAMPGQTDWGRLNGRNLSFNHMKDRVAANRWFIDQLTGRFAAQGFKNIDLTGLYWIDEDMISTADAPKTIADYVHSKGLKFVWIPYFTARGHERWRQLGFDMVYHQPNHFFNRSIPDTRLDRAVQIADSTGMAMEFECDERALSQSRERMGSRMHAYIDAYERLGVFDSVPLAYYTGSHLLLDFTRQPSTDNQALADRLARLIVARRKH